MIEQLEKYPSNSRLAMLIRHADRERIPDGEFGNEIPINEKGKKNAIAFGEKLQGKDVNRIFTSPIHRCIQTAEHISLGYNKKLDIITSKCLGDPGLHTEDELIAGEFYLKHGFDELYRRFVDGETIPGVASHANYHLAMTKFLEENTKDPGLTIFVTHDSLIVFYDFCLSGKIYNKENWVKYLSGLILNY